MIYLSLCCAVVIAACSDKDNGEGPDAKPSNEYRVTQIEGRNAHWGEYTMTMKYHLQALDSIIVTDAAGERIAFMKASQDENGAIIFSMNDIVSNIDAEAIAELGPDEDIPTVERELLRIRSEYRNGILQAQTFTYSRPKADNGTGADFNSEYLDDRRIRYVYEYDGGGELYICRIINDVYDPDRNSQFIRTVSKMVAESNGGMVNKVSAYMAEGDPESESYVLDDTFNFTWSGNRLTGVGSTGTQISYTWTDGNMTVMTTSDGTYTYAYNSDGSIRRIDMPGGEYMEMAYEQGAGDFELYTPAIEKTFGVQFVK